MKNRVFLVLICLVVIGLLTACGGKSDSAAAPSAEVPVPVTTPANKEGSIAELFAKAQGIDSMYFEFVMISGSEKSEGKTWTKGMLIKNEITADGQKIINIIDMDKKESFTYMPAQNIAMRLDLSKLQGQEYEVHKPTEYGDFVSPEFTKVVETTIYDGHRCKVLIVTDANGKEQMKMWVAEEYGIPLRVETTDDGEKTSLEYKNLKVGPLSDDIFTLPAGVEIMGNG